VLSTNSYPALPGIVICLIGAMLRFASSGFLRKEAALSVGGPYRFTRNPLYMGTMLMGVGAFVSIGAYGLGAIMAVWFVVNYGFVIEFEESKLPNFFGNPYLVYKTLVPRFFPRIPAAPIQQLMQINPNPETYRFSFALAWKNKAYEALLSFLGIIGGLYLVAFLKMHYMN
jgi:hypothetical protein